MTSTEFEQEAVKRLAEDLDIDTVYKDGYYIGKDVCIHLLSKDAYIKNSIEDGIVGEADTPTADDAEGWWDEEQKIEVYNEQFAVMR